jgi:hypothetical protein
MREFNKIFGLGFPKTGTCTLTEALNILGVKTVHYPTSVLDEIDDGVFEFSVMHEYDGLTNVGEILYPQLDNHYPGSLYILTTRPVSDWLGSMKMYRRVRGDWDNTNTRDARWLFGCATYSEERWGWAFEEHARRVKEYFADRPNDLLVVSWDDGCCWEKLCGFLGVDVPDQPFPWLHRTRPPECYPDTRGD